MGTVEVKQLKDPHGTTVHSQLMHRAIKDIAWSHEGDIVLTVGSNYAACGRVITPVLHGRQGDILRELRNADHKQRHPSPAVSTDEPQPGSSHSLVGQSQPASSPAASPAPANVKPQPHASHSQPEPSRHRSRSPLDLPSTSARQQPMVLFDIGLADDASKILPGEKPAW